MPLGWGGRGEGEGGERERWNLSVYLASYSIYGTLKRCPSRLKAMMG